MSNIVKLHPQVLVLPNVERHQNSHPSWFNIECTSTVELLNDGGYEFISHIALILPIYKQAHLEHPDIHPGLVNLHFAGHDTKRYWQTQNLGTLHNNYIWTFNCARQLYDHRELYTAYMQETIMAAFMRFYAADRQLPANSYTYHMY